MQLKEEKLSKPKLRAYFDKMRREMSLEEKRKADLEIESRLLCSWEYSKADVVLTYISVELEPDTRGIISAAFANGKTVAVPKCGENGGMDFYVIKSLDRLVTGKYGLLEPDVSICEKASVTENSLCIVPGLSFDAEGFRLGRGGGYYDRFLKSFKGASVGLCYNSFLRLSLTRDPFDVPVDIIVTENFLREIKS